MATIGTFVTRIMQKHDTKTNWDKATTFIPKAGEICIYDADGNTLKEPKFKVGDGATTVVNLPYSDKSITDAIAQNTNDISSNTTAISGKQKTIQKCTITLTGSKTSATAWTDKAQTINNISSTVGLTADSLVIVSPAPSSFIAYGDAQIRATAQGVSSLTFVCESVPEDDIEVNVVVG